MFHGYIYDNSAKMFYELSSELYPLSVLPNKQKKQYSTIPLSPLGSPVPHATSGFRWLDFPQLQVLSETLLMTHITNLCDVHVMYLCTV